MLKIMRKNASSLLIKIIFGIIVIVFVFWGVGSFQEGDADRVASVNGEPISLESYRSAYDSYVENIRQQYGSSVNREFLKMFQIPQQVISSLVTQELLKQEAEKMDLRVTDTELAEAIQSIESFQDNGVFNSQRYTYLLERNNLTPELFESSQRQSMLIEKLSGIIESGLKITDGEIKDWYGWINAMVDINYVMFTPSDFDELIPTDDELSDYYEDNKESYMTEPKIKVRYMAFRPDQYRDKVQVEDDEIENYYDNNISEFQTEKTVEARHILFSLDEDATDEVVEEKLKKAKEIAELAREGQDFSDLAKEYSEGTTRETGGLLGEFKEGDMVEPFSEAAFAMAEGEISDPVRTQFGWHVIKVEAVHPESVSPIEEVTDDIRETLMKEYAEEYAYDNAMDAFDQALDDEDFQKTAGDFGQVLLESEYFTAEGPQSGVSDPGTFATAAFEMSGSEISDVLNIGENFYIMQKIGEQPSVVPSLEEVSDQVKNDLMGQMQEMEANKKAKEFLAEMKASGGMVEAAAQQGIEVSSSGFFKRSESIPSIGYETEIIEAAFKLSEESKSSNEVFSGSAGYYVIEFRERKTPEMDELESQRENIRSQLLSQKQQIIFETWLQTLRTESEVVVEDGYLN